MLSIFTQLCSSGVRAAASLARTEAQRFSSASAAFSADACDKQEDKTTVQVGKRFVGFKWPGINVGRGHRQRFRDAIAQPAPVRDGAPNETVNRWAGRQEGQQ